jgi:uncharacterized protein YbjT (DUF2867 family)
VGKATVYRRWPNRDELFLEPFDSDRRHARCARPVGSRGSAAHAYDDRRSQASASFFARELYFARLIEGTRKIAGTGTVRRQTSKRATDDSCPRPSTAAVHNRIGSTAAAGRARVINRGDEARSIMKTIAIIGRDGTNARPWISTSLASGWRVRNLVRDPGKVASHRSLTAVAFDFEDNETYEPALAGVDVFALISPARPEQVEWESKLITAAKKGGAGGIIQLSVIGADMAKPISFFARNAAEVESALRASGVPYVILRANGFMQNLLRQRTSIEAGGLVEPSGGAATSRIDVNDIADVAVAVSKRPFDGDVLTLTGPVASTCDEMAATLSTVLKRPARYISPRLGQFRAALSGRGLPGWQVDAFVEVQEAILTGQAPHLAIVTNDVMRETGRPPGSFAQFAVREFGPTA